MCRDNFCVTEFGQSSLFSLESFALELADTTQQIMLHFERNITTFNKIGTDYIKKK